MKWIITLLFFIGLSLLILLRINTSNSQPVYLEYNNNSNYERFYLNVEKIYLTTKNINKYFSNIKIIGILPLFSGLYTSYYQVNWYYFSDIDNTLELRDIEEMIIKTLKKKNFNQEGENIRFNGVRLQTLLVEATYKDIKELQLKYPNIVIV